MNAMSIIRILGFIDGDRWLVFVNKVMNLRFP
jgi:hypothetical protein